MELQEELANRVGKLPKWAQKCIDDLIFEVNRRDGLVVAHGLLCDEKRDWFTIPNKSEGTMHLWLLNKDRPHSICSLDEGDVLLVGRRKT